MKNTIRFAAFVLSLTLSSCGGGEHSATDTGSASFGLKFEEASAPAMKLAPSMAPADICTSYGIDSISGTVYNSSNTAIATGGPWACSAHQGTINNIPPGSNLRIAVKGTVSGTVVWHGETTGATIYAGQNTNVGKITMTYMVLASGQSNPRSIAVDATNVYWANETSTGTVSKVPIAGGMATVLASGQNYPSGIAVDSAYVYWTNSGTGTVNKIPIVGGTVTVLASGQNYPKGIAVDSAYVYWTNYSGTVNKIPIGGGTATVLASGNAGDIYGIAVDSANVYWTDQGSSTSGTVSKVPISGGTATVLAAERSWCIAVDATNVYWTNIGGVNRIPIDGGTVTVLASASGQSWPWGIAVDFANVYWVDSGTGTVNTIPK